MSIVGFVFVLFSVVFFVGGCGVLVQSAMFRVHFFNVMLFLALTADK